LRTNPVEIYDDLLFQVLYSDVELELLLPTAILLAHSVNNTEFEDWAKIEYDGYHENSPVALKYDGCYEAPKYRTIKGYFMDSSENKIGIEKDLFLPSNEMTFYSSISRLEGYANSDSEIKVAFPDICFRGKAETVYLVFDPSKFRFMLKIIRSVLRDYLLDIKPIIDELRTNSNTKRNYKDVSIDSGVASVNEDSHEHIIPAKIDNIGEHSIVKDRFAVICHADEDNEKALTVYNILEKNGISCWIDDRDLIGGQKYGEAITGAIKNCKAVIYIHSSNCINSIDIPNELQIARDNKKYIVIFRLDDSPYSDDVYYRLATIQYIKSFPENIEFYIPQLIRSLAVSSTNEESLTIIVGKLYSPEKFEVGIGSAIITLLEKDMKLMPSDSTHADINGWSVAMYTKTDAFGWYILPTTLSTNKIYKVYAKWEDSASHIEPTLKQPWSLNRDLYDFKNASGVFGEKLSDSFAFNGEKCLIKYIQLKTNPLVFGDS
jgi:hypothetical protein